MAKQAKYRVDLPDGSSHLCATFAEAQAVERQHARKNPDWAAIRAKAAEGARATGKALAKAGRKTAAGIKAAAPGVGQALKHSWEGAKAGFKAAKEQNPPKGVSEQELEKAFQDESKRAKTVREAFRAGAYVVESTGEVVAPNAKAQQLLDTARALYESHKRKYPWYRGDIQQNPGPEEHKRRAGQRYTAAVRSGDPLDAARLAFQAESDFDDAGDRRGAEDAHAYALSELKASRRNPPKPLVRRKPGRNPASYNPREAIADFYADLNLRQISHDPSISHIEVKKPVDGSLRVFDHRADVVYDFSSDHPRFVFIRISKDGENIKFAWEKADPHALTAFLMAPLTKNPAGPLVRAEGDLPGGEQYSGYYLIGEHSDQHYYYGPFPTRAAADSAANAKDFMVALAEGWVDHMEIPPIVAWRVAKVESESVNGSSYSSVVLTWPASAAVSKVGKTAVMPAKLLNKRNPSTAGCYAQNPLTYKAPKGKLAVLIGAGLTPWSPHLANTYIAPRLVPVATLEAAGKAVRDFINRTGIGGESWSAGVLGPSGVSISGMVFDDKGQPVSRIAYNGRAFDITAADRARLGMGD